jgi:Ni,Fe-hydrogenase III large subunit/Ni,Fe-hydrogenase III component G
MMRSVFEELQTQPAHIRQIADELHRQNWRLGTIVASTVDDQLLLRYCFYGTNRPEWKVVRVAVGPDRSVPSLTPVLIAADWFEREIEDLFSIRFSEHPRLGDFVLHDDMWAEEVGLMRHAGAPGSVEGKRMQRPWEPHRVLQEEGAFVMPVGPIFSGEAESALFLLETVGEDVVRSLPRLFYKYRAIEKLAEGKALSDALLLAERCNGTSAIGNGWSYCRAAESALGIEVPKRGKTLRGFFAELERVRHHVTAIREICGSTALTVATSQLLLIEEQFLRVCGDLCGHRYLFGVLRVGGLTRDFNRGALQHAARRARELAKKIRDVADALAETSSFLDRIERVGIIEPEQARSFELVGPVARASSVAADMRVVQPYEPYESMRFRVPLETEGDGYARLRVLFAEIEESTRLLEAVLEDLSEGPVSTEFSPRRGSALGWTEAPRGASIAWVSTREDGTLERFRLTPPSARNWHGFHIATEEFAFQDFPIILATMDLSVAENDR